MPCQFIVQVTESQSKRAYIVSDTKGETWWDHKVHAEFRKLLHLNAVEFLVFYQILRLPPEVKNHFRGHPTINPVFHIQHCTNHMSELKVGARMVFCGTALHIQLFHTKPLTAFRIASCNFVFFLEGWVVSPEGKSWDRRADKYEKNVVLCMGGCMRFVTYGSGRMWGVRGDVVSYSWKLGGATLLFARSTKRLQWSSL